MGAQRILQRNNQIRTSTSAYVSTHIKPCLISVKGQSALSPPIPGCLGPRSSLCVRPIYDTRALCPSASSHFVDSFNTSTNNNNNNNNHRSLRFFYQKDAEQFQS